jgi:RNA polymerase sigma factor (sigma-70 family)
VSLQPRPSPDAPGAWLAHYSELKASLYVKLARQLGLHGPAGRDVFGDLFQIAATAAWLTEQAGERIRNLPAFLSQVIINQRKMQLRTQRRRPATSWDALVETAESSGGAPALELMADRGPSVTDEVERHELAEAIVDIVLAIEPRARKVWTMRFLEERTPEEVMAALGITRRQYARLFDRATKAIHRKLLAYLAGDWCPGYASRFARLAAGRATAEQAEQAQQHLSACPACRHAYETFTRLHPSP